VAKQFGISQKFPSFQDRQSLSLYDMIFYPLLSTLLRQNINRKKFRIGTSPAELAVVCASRMKIIHVVTVITFPVTDKVIYTFIYYYLMENRPYI